MSELSPAACFSLEGKGVIGSCGQVLPNTQMKIVDVESGETLGPNQPGELYVRGPQVMKGYLGNQEATDKTIKDGWLLTGDIGRLDWDGYIYITDRKKDMLLVNGINVYPREVEEVIYQFDGIKEASVVGVNDPRKGDVIVACVVPSEGAGLDEEALIVYLKTKLAAYKIPRKVLKMEALPKTATGKILKTKLREIAAEKVAR